MPTYHRSQRLRLVGTGPKVEQLQESRFRLTFTCTATNPNEAWMNGNKDQIMTAYGTLQSAQKNIAGIDPRTDEAYSDMVLFRTEANPSERDLIITLVYETATGSFVKSQDDKLDFELNGLQRVTRITVAKTGTSLPSVTIGSTSITVNSIACKLASRSVEENDAFIQITETYLQEGTVSQSIDNVGSQLAQVITTFGANPGTPTGYALASKEESNFAGYQTNTFRFLKNDVQLSKTVDNESPLKTEVQEWFNPESDNDRDSKTGYSLINERESNIDGIPTVRYTFAKNNSVISVSEDKVGSQNAIVNEVFNPTSESITGVDTDNVALSGYSEVDRTESNYDGIKTIRVRFLKPSILSVTQDFVEDINTIQVTAFSKSEAEVKTALTEVTANHKLINQRENDHDGIVTTTYTFEINTSDVVEYTANNRLQVTRTIYESYDYDYNANYDVGTTGITFESTALKLSSLRVNKRGDSGTFVKLEAVFTEPGESARSKRVGPTSMPGTEQITITSSGSTAVTLTETDDIKLISEQEQNNNGFSSFVRSYIKGTEATSTTNSYTSGRTYKINSNGNYSSVGGPSTGIIGDYFQATSSDTLGSGVTAYLVGQIIGTKVTYENIVSVQVPGTVKCVTYEAVGDLATNVTNNNKSQATIESVPPNTIKIKATVTESIQTSVPTISALAYNLDDISCSVARIGTTYRETAGPTVSTGNGVITVTGVQRNASLSTNNSYYPGSYILDNDNSAIAVTSAVKGRQYRIISAGDTDFTAIGAADSFANTVFIATGAGTGTGTVRDFGSEGKLTYQSSETPRSTGDTSSTTDTGQSDTITTIITKGTTSQSDGSAPSSYSTTGTIQQKARPVLTTIDGTTYYEVITFSKS